MDTEKFMYLYIPKLRAGLESSLSPKFMLRAVIIDMMAYIISWVRRQHVLDKTKGTQRG